MIHRRSLLAAFALALGLPAARAADLDVDTVDGNAATPFAITADAAYDSVRAGDQGTGEIDQSAGTLTVGTADSRSGGSLVFNVGYNVGSQGTYDLSGNAALHVEGISDVGTFGNGTVNQTGGTANFDSNYVGTLTVGAYNGGVGTYNQSGGTVTTSLMVISDYAGSAGTYNLNGGTLSAAVFGGFDGGTDSTFNLNGGTLQAAAQGNNLLSALTRANVRDNGAIIDANGFSAYIPQTLSHSNVQNDAAIDGGLTVGSSLPGGSVTLFANNGYTGRTLVNSGALFVDNVPGKAGVSGTGSGSVYVNSGAWLGGTGTIGGNVIVGSGGPSFVTPGLRPQFSVALGTLTPGDSLTPTATLTINGNLTLAPSFSMLEMDLGDPASVGSDMVKVGGTLTVGGNLELTLAAGFTPTPLETFVLIDVTGSATTTGTFENTTANGTLYTDASGDTFLISYNADADNDLAFNDVTATFLGVPEPSTWAMLVVGGMATAGITLRRRAGKA